MKRNAAEGQQFTFDFTFNETVAAIKRINEDANAEPTDDQLGEPNVNRTITTTGGSETSTVSRDNQISSSGTVSPKSVEDIGPLGDEFAGQTEEIGATGRSDTAGQALGTAESGAGNSVGGGGVPQYGSVGGRSLGDEPRSDGTNVAPIRDYVITSTDRLGEGGAKSKYRDNIAALKLLKTFQEDDRPATLEEQAVLVKYVGWGGLAQAFDHRNTDWRNEFQELSALLDRDDYEAARRSTQDAHYTAQPVIEAMYSALVDHFGFDGGRILESAMGSGNFVGLMPRAIVDTSKVTGIELDPTTAQIAKKLYPSVALINKGFQEVTIPERYFDLAIGNPPFGSQSVYDANHRDISQFSIHNYFIAKSLDKVREGGLVAVVVSSYFMDARDSAAREHIAQSAHLLGAIRLPNTAFKQNALTEVTTDMVFLQRIKEGENVDRSWIDVGELPDAEGVEPIPVNSYFVKRPEMMLGTMERKSGMYGGGTPTLVARPKQDLAADLASAISRLPEGFYIGRDASSVIDLVSSTPAGAAIDVPVNIKVGAFFVTQAGRVVQRLDDLLDVPQARNVEGKSDKALERIRGMIEIRTSLRELMRSERMEEFSDSEIEEMRGNLNQTYDRYVKSHGHISSLVNKQAMGEDPDFPLLQSLERDYDKGISKETAKKNGIDAREPSAKKASIFSQRVMSPRREVTKVENSKDALVVSMNETGGIDLDLMIRLSGKSEEAVVRDLQGLIFQNPRTQRWETADHYLTGNVKAKLAVALDEVERDGRYRGNVEALKLVQPPDIEAVDISMQLGSTWVPDEVVNEFVGHILGNVHRTVSYQQSLGKWVAKIGFGDQTTMRATWGTAEAPANELIESILVNRPIKVEDIVGYDDFKNPIRKTNEAKTAAALQKADEIKQAFLDWVWEDRTRRESLVRLYNDRFNTNVVPHYDGSHLTLPGASNAVDLRRHQKDATWRGIQEGTDLNDHVVGAGKTFVCVAISQESKRMGLTKKPMFVVPNHLLLQWKDDIYKLYPDANVLIAEKSDFTKENRQKLFSRIATGDWDAVVIGHSSFKKIGMPQQTLERILNEQIDDLANAVIAIKAEKGDRVTIKEMEKARDRMKAKLERASETGSKDKVVTFDELGIDALFVDEADEFKNLFITTSLSRISGLGNLQGSDKAFDLFVKARYLQQKQDGKGLYFATGTPVANTIAEIYTMQRYMQYDELKERGIHHFDSWVSTFGQVVTGWELDATGVNYRLNSRFSKFQNVPELTAMYRTFADVITREDLQRHAEELGTRFPIPKVKGGKPLNIVVKRSPLQAKYMGLQEPVLDGDGNPHRRADGSLITSWTQGSIIHRMENLPADPRIDNPLKITNDARKAGLDFRLIDPDAPDFEGSKSNVAVGEMIRIWEKWKDQRGVQLVFCDLSTPKLGKNVVSTVVGNDSPLAAQDEEGGEVEEVSMDEILSGGNSAKFSVYNDVKEKLIARGVPENQIRFIHEAKTDLQRAKLFEQVRKGEVVFLFGSTAKMGAGTNVQDLLVAEHHLDAPWRPRDLEQREGRIIRQGNKFYLADPDGFEVEILRYATEQTYDARMWQTIEFKAHAIEQFRRGDGIARVIEDVAGAAANAAEMKAAATGNPLIFLQVQLASDLKKLDALYSNFKRNNHSLESRVDWLSEAEVRAKQEVDLWKQEIARRNGNTTKEWSVKIGEKTFSAESKEVLRNAMLGSMQMAYEGRAKSRAELSKDVHICKYRGFTISVSARNDSLSFRLKGEKFYSPGTLSYNKEDKFSVTGFLRRIDNFVESFEEVIQDAQLRCSQELLECSKAKTELGKPFMQLRELELARKNASDVMVELRKMQDDSAYVSGWEPATLATIPFHEDDLFSTVDPQAAAREEKAAAHQRQVTDSIDRAAQDYLRGLKEPLRGDEIFNRGHQRLLEEGGEEVHLGLIERIKTDRPLAEAVSAAPGKRFASEAMLDAAESVTQFRAAAFAAVEEKGLNPELPNRDSGNYVGKMIGQTPHFVLQATGMGQAIVHHRDDLMVTKPSVGENVRITYRTGFAMVRRIDKDKEQSPDKDR